MLFVKLLHLICEKIQAPGLHGPQYSSIIIKQKSLKLYIIAQNITTEYSIDILLKHTHNKSQANRIELIEGKRVLHSIVGG